MSPSMPALRDFPMALHFPTIRRTAVQLSMAHARRPRAPWFAIQEYATHRTTPAVTRSAMVPATPATAAQSATAEHAAFRTSVNQPEVA